MRTCGEASGGLFLLPRGQEAAEEGNLVGEEGSEHDLEQAVRHACRRARVGLNKEQGVDGMVLTEYDVKVTSV